MKRLFFLLFFTIIYFSCNSTDVNESISEAMKLEIDGLKKVNQSVVSDLKIFQYKKTKEYKKYEKIFNSINELKFKFKENQKFEDEDVQFFSTKLDKFKRYSDFPFEHLKLFTNSSLSNSERFKYLLYLEYYFHQNLYSSLNSNYFRVEAIQPFVLTNNEKYKLNEDVKVKIGYLIYSNEQTLEFSIGDKKYKKTFEELAKEPILLKATNLGSNKIPGSLIYHGISDTIHQPFFIEFEVE